MMLFGPNMDTFVHVEAPSSPSLSPGLAEAAAHYNSGGGGAAMRGPSLQMFFSGLALSRDTPRLRAFLDLYNCFAPRPKVLQSVYVTTTTTTPADQQHTDSAVAVHTTTGSRISSSPVRFWTSSRPIDTTVICDDPSLMSVVDGPSPADAASAQWPQGKCRRWSQLRCAQGGMVRMAVDDADLLVAVTWPCPMVNDHVGRPTAAITSLTPYQASAVGGGLPALLGAGCTPYIELAQVFPFVDVPEAWKPMLAVLLRLREQLRGEKHPTTTTTTADSEGAGAASMPANGELRLIFRLPAPLRTASAVCEPWAAPVAAVRFPDVAALEASTAFPQRGYHSGGCGSVSPLSFGAVVGGASCLHLHAASCQDALHPPPLQIVWRWSEGLGCFWCPAQTARTAVVLHGAPPPAAVVGWIDVCAARGAAFPPCPAEAIAVLEIGSTSDSAHAPPTTPPQCHCTLYHGGARALGGEDVRFLFSFDQTIPLPKAMTDAVGRLLRSASPSVVGQAFPRGVEGSQEARRIAADVITVAVSLYRHNLRRRGYRNATDLRLSSSQRSPPATLPRGDVGVCQPPPSASAEDSTDAGAMLAPGTAGKAPLISSAVKRSSRVADIANFVAFTDGTVHAAFDDRTLVILSVPPVAADAADPRPSAAVSASRLPLVSKEDEEDDARIVADIITVGANKLRLRVRGMPSDHELLPYVQWAMQFRFYAFLENDDLRTALLLEPLGGAREQLGPIPRREAEGEEIDALLWRTRAAILQSKNVTVANRSATTGTFATTKKVSSSS